MIGCRRGWRILRALAGLGLGILLSAGCPVWGHEGSAGSHQVEIRVGLVDIWPPDPVGDLLGVAPLVEGQAALSWTAPFEDSGVALPKTNPVASYTVRLATFSADSVSSTTTWWNAAQDAAGEPAPLAPGSLQSMLLTALEPSVTHYFAIESVDPAGNTSAIDTASLIGPPAQASALIYDAVPSSPTGLAITGVWLSSASLSWNAVPAYDLDFYNIYIDSTSPYDFADQYVLSVDSTSTSFTHTGITQGESYSYYVTAVDKGAPLFPGSALESSSSSVVSILTGLQPVALNSALPNAPQNRISLAWTNPNPDPRYALILRQAGSAPSTPPASGVPYNVGDLLGGATVAFNASGNSFVDAGLALNTTWYYALFARSSALQYSAEVSTAVLLDLRPLFAAGLSRTLASDKSQVSVSWSPVTAEENGVPFINPLSPTLEELSGYYVYRSTALWGSGVRLVQLGPSATSYTDSILGADYYYYLTAFDRYNQESEPSLKIRAFTGDLHIAPADKRFQVKISKDLADFLNKGNPTAQNLHVTAVYHPEEVGAKVLESTEFVPRRGDDGAAVSKLAFPEAKLGIFFYYQTSGGALSFSPQTVTNPSNELGVYWYNGSQWIKMFGEADLLNQSVSINSGLLGKYQVREVFRTLAAPLNQPLNRFITPNGDRKNDYAVIVYDDPGDATASGSVSGKIYDLKGAFVADMRPSPAAQFSLEWDGKAGGQAVPGGVYIYQLVIEDKVFNGTLVVIR